jgi:hypothetical protein
MMMMMMMMMMMLMLMMMMMMMMMRSAGRRGQRHPLACLRVSLRFAYREDRSSVCASGRTGTVLL